MSRRIIFFINPVSGTKSKNFLEQKIHQKCAERSVYYEVLFTAKDGKYDYLKEKVQRENITDVVVCGGDGSIGPVIASLLDTEINIGIIPLGSGNGLAATAHIPQSINKAFKNIFEGKARGTDAFLVNQDLGCHLMGLGYDAKVAYEFSKQRKRGVNTYIKEVIKHFFSSKPYHFEIETEGKIFKEEAFFISVTNSNQFGNNFRIAPQASLSDGLLDVVIVKKSLKPILLLGMVKHVLAGKTKGVSKTEFDRKHILYFQTTKILIRNLGNAPLQIDGDPVETGNEFLVEVLPSAFQLIQPDNKQ